MSTNPNTQGAGHDFSSRGRKMLWGVPQSSIQLQDHQPPELEKTPQNHDIEPHNKPCMTFIPRIAPVNYILKPKSRDGQEWIKATGDFKPPHARISRQISSFVTLDQTGNKVNYYKCKPKPGHQRLPSYIRNEEIVSRAERIKRCTLHSYLRCDKYTVDKKNCNVCGCFREKRRNENL